MKQLAIRLALALVAITGGCGDQVGPTENDPHDPPVAISPTVFVRTVAHDGPLSGDTLSGVTLGIQPDLVLNGLWHGPDPGVRVTDTLGLAKWIDSLGIGRYIVGGVRLDGYACKGKVLSSLFSPLPPTDIQCLYIAYHGDGATASSR